MAGSTIEFAAQASLSPNRYILLCKRIAACLALFGIMVALQTPTLKEVSIIVGGEEVRTVYTASARVGATLAQVGINVNEGDVIEPAPDTRVEAGDTINITRAYPVPIMVDGELVEIRTVGCTVQEALNMANIKLGLDDKVLPAASQRVSADTKVRVIRVTYAYEAVEEALGYNTERRMDPTLEKGKTRIAREGVPGRIRRTMKLTYEDGNEVKRVAVSSEVIKDPVDQILIVGMRIIPRLLHTASGKTYEYTEMREMLATAYEPGPRSTGKWADGFTYTGAKATKGVVAVDPKVIPLGTRLYIPGYGEALAADIGGAIKGNRIDLCYDTVKEALQFGRRTVKVYILAGK